MLAYMFQHTRKCSRKKPQKKSEAKRKLGWPAVFREARSLVAANIFYDEPGKIKAIDHFAIRQQTFRNFVQQPWTRQKREEDDENCKSAMFDKVFGASRVLDFLDWHNICAET